MVTTNKAGAGRHLLAGRRVVMVLALAAAASLHPARTAQAVTIADPTARGEVVETTFKSVDATVAAQWEFPARTPAPLVVLIPASEALDRHGLPPGYGADLDTGIYAQLAKRLVAAGFAVFRFDSPGTGRSSPGRYATVRSNALEAYTHAVEHAKVDPDKVFLFGHAWGTDTIVGIYSRYAQVKPPAGVILFSNMVGETDIVQVDAPTLIVVSDKLPDDLYQRGRFPADARDNFKDKKLETKLVTIPAAEPTLLAPVEKSGGGKNMLLDPRAVDAVIEWLQAHTGGTPT
ncbi:MAG TPA: alpha/beta fold hydrolase [Candidatus Limnocylindrales bacterium]|nr:alpha/beta fold hydrolase [Candidatus Limnocylindrales bacterium]